MAIVLPGTYRHKIELQSPVAIMNAYGEEELTWTTYATVRAQVSPQSWSVSSQQMVQATVLTQTLTKFRMRYRKNVTSDHRVKWTAQGQTRYYRIENVTAPMENRRELLVVGEEVFPEAIQ